MAGCTLATMIASQTSDDGAPATITVSTFLFLAFSLLVTVLSFVGNLVGMKVRSCAYVLLRLMHDVDGVE